MPAVKNILRHVALVQAARKRQCYRHKTKNPILKGEWCLVVEDGPQDVSTYCKICATEILKAAQVKLDELALLYRS